MYSSSLLVLALAVFGASAQTLISSGCGVNGIVGGFNGVVGGVNGVVGGLNGVVGGVNGIVGGYNGIVGGVSSGVVGGVSPVAAVAGGAPQVIENIPVRLPSIINQATVQDTCNCIKTVVRPQYRKEVFTIPSVQRFIQTTSTPVVETLPYVTGSSADIPSASGVVSGVASGVASGVVSGVEGGLIGGYGSGLVNGGVIGGGVIGGGLVNSGVVSGIGSGVVSGINSGVVSGISSGCAF